ncbi:hypothetical protein IAT38_002507 [Cryptococcus sp. DSM 104549]
MEFHLVPFWTFSLICEQVVGHRHYPSGSPNLAASPVGYHSDMGFSMAAVASNHWARSYSQKWILREQLTARDEPLFKIKAPKEASKGPLQSIFPKLGSQSPRPQPTPPPPTKEPRPPRPKSASPSPSQQGKLKFGQTMRERRKAAINVQARQHLAGIMRDRTPVENPAQAQSLPATVPDPEGLYALLGISQPGSLYLDRLREAEANRLIDAGYKMMGKIKHPDGGGSNAEFAALTNADQRLETFAKRKLYYERRSLITRQLSGSSRRLSTVFTESPSSPTIDDVLPKQDPYGRIWFKPPMEMEKYTSNRARLNRIREDWLSVYSASPYLVPFWSIVIMCDSYSQFRSLKGSSHLSEIARIPSDISLAIAAVDESHWCSGAFISEDVRGIAMTYDTMANLGDDGLRFLPSKSSSMYNVNAVGEDFIGSMYDPSRMAKFHLPPPKLDAREIGRITDAQVHEDPDDVLAETLTKGKDPLVYAFPTYRLIYRATDLSSRDVIFYDSELAAVNHRSFHVNWSPGMVRPVVEEKSPRALHFMRLAFAREKEQRGQSMLMTSFLPYTKGDDVVTTVYNSMRRRGPMTPAMWEDDHILPLFGQAAGQPGVQALAKFSSHRIRNIDSVVKGGEPAYPIKRAAAPAARLVNLFGKLPAQPQTKAEKPTASKTSSSPSPSFSFLSSSKSFSRSLPLGTSMRAKRQAALSSRLAAKADRIAQSMPQAPPKLEKPVDSAGHYYQLGLHSLEADLLDSRAEATVDKRIKDQYHQLSFKLHPDQGGEREDFERLVQAYKQVGTLAKRQQYHAQVHNRPFRLFTTKKASQSPPSAPPKPAPKPFLDDPQGFYGLLGYPEPPKDLVHKAASGAYDKAILAAYIKKSEEVVGEASSQLLEAFRALGTLDGRRKYNSDVA